MPERQTMQRSWKIAAKERTMLRPSPRVLPMLFPDVDAFRSRAVVLAFVSVFGILPNALRKRMDGLKVQSMISMVLAMGFIILTIVLAVLKVRLLLSSLSLTLSVCLCVSLCVCVCVCVLSYICPLALCVRAFVLACIRVQSSLSGHGGAFIHSRMRTCSLNERERTDHHHDASTFSLYA